MPPPLPVPTPVPTPVPVVSAMPQSTPLLPLSECAIAIYRSPAGIGIVIGIGLASVSAVVGGAGGGGGMLAASDLLDVGVGGVRFNALGMPRKELSNMFTCGPVNSLLTQLLVLRPAVLFGLWWSTPLVKTLLQSESLYRVTIATFTRQTLSNCRKIIIWRLANETRAILAIQFNIPSHKSQCKMIFIDM